MRQLYKLMFVLLSTSVHAEEMIDPNLISPIDCPMPVIQTEVKIQPKINTITNFGYSSSRSNYSLNTVHVGTYVLVDIDGVYYRKYMVFNQSRWTEILIKD